MKRHQGNSKAAKAVSFDLGYKPNPAQERFAQVIDAGAKVILFVGGIRSGKTHAGVIECLKQVYKSKHKAGLGWIVSPNFPMSAVTEQKLREQCYKHNNSLIAYERKGKRQFFMKPGPKNPNTFFEISIKSAENPNSLRGFSLDWILLDEAAMMHPDVFTVAQGRVLDTNGLIILTTTPMGKNWLYNDVFLRSLTDPRYAVITAKTGDNFYLDPKEVEELYARYSDKSDALARQEMDAEFCDFDGLVFSKFRLDTHTIPERDLPHDADVYCGIDWGYNDPFVCVWLTKIDGVWVLLDEYYRSKGLLAEHYRHLASHPLAKRVRRYWCDPSALQERKEFAKLGIRCAPARRPNNLKQTQWPVSRARLMNSLFARGCKSPWDKKQDMPGLVFFNTARHTIREFTGLVYERNSETLKDGSVRVYDKKGSSLDKNATEKIVDKNNHTVDAMGYILFSEEKSFAGIRPHYEDPVTGEAVAVEKSQEAKELEHKRLVNQLFEEEHKRVMRKIEDERHNLDSYF